MTRKLEWQAVDGDWGADYRAFQFCVSLNASPTRRAKKTFTLFVNAEERETFNTLPEAQAYAQGYICGFDALCEA